MNPKLAHTSLVASHYISLWLAIRQQKSTLNLADSSFARGLRVSFSIPFMTWQENYYSKEKPETANIIH